MSRVDFRPFVPAGGSPKIAGRNAREHSAHRVGERANHPLFGVWDELARAPFRGITANGEIEPDLFALAPDGAPVAAMCAAADALIARLSNADRQRTLAPLTSPHRRAWQNTEVWVETHGLRLEQTDADTRAAALALVRASLSPVGYREARDVMRLNAFLGDLIGAPAILGEWSYTFTLFGTPHLVEPWGWQLFGHHLALDCLLVAGRISLTPAFLGAEPSYADAGPFAGTQLFEDRECDGLALVRSFSAAQQDRAILSHDILCGDLPPGRRHFADNLNLAGAFQDNRIIPYEGLPADAMTAAQRRRLADLIARYLGALPPAPFAARMAEVERHLAATHFCWIGATDDERPFYYRIQSPVVLIEFDHHKGVFLINETPQRFHVHTIVRTPNGNDYGMDLLRRHYETVHRSSIDRNENILDRDGLRDHSLLG